MVDRPNHISLPPTPMLRSAMKRSLTPTPGSQGSQSSSPTATPTFGPGSASLSLSEVTSIMTSNMPSPSPGYLPKVSFDTFENPSAPMFSFTLHVKSEGYKRNRDTRVFLCAASPDESGGQALDWVMESLVQDGDELIVFRGIDMDEMGKDHDLLRDDARELLGQVQKQNVEYDSDRKLSIIIEFVAGKVTATIERLIALYRPDSLVVGSRGQRGMFGHAFGMGSVSKHCLSHSPVPVIVVRPERKVRKAMEKRRADPKRGIHFEEMRSNDILAVPTSPSPRPEAS